MVLEAPHPPVSPQDLTEPCNAIESLQEYCWIVLSNISQNKHVGQASLVLEESLFVSATLRRLLKTSSSMCKVAPVILPRLRCSGRSAGNIASGSAIHPISARFCRSEKSGDVLCLSELVLLPYFL